MLGCANGTCLYTHSASALVRHASPSSSVPSVCTGTDNPLLTTHRPPRSSAAHSTLMSQRARDALSSSRDASFHPSNCGRRQLIHLL